MLLINLLELVLPMLPMRLEPMLVLMLILMTTMTMLETIQKILVRAVRVADPAVCGAPVYFFHTHRANNSSLGAPSRQYQSCVGYHKWFGVRCGFYVE